MSRCKKCHGSLKSTRMNIVLQVEGHAVEVLNVPVKVCNNCGDVTYRVLNPENMVEFLQKYFQDEGPVDKLDYNDLANRYVIFPTTL
ncbi:MAG: YgiT-type zinc finger protein [Anaerolineales bacterium]|jgi:YgiT-type zinc finger domain-containing protein